MDGVSKEDKKKKKKRVYRLSNPRQKWTEEEHQLFLEALQVHGKQWKQIQEVLQTKSAIQIRSHAQKYFNKLKKDVADAGLDPNKPATAQTGWHFRCQVSAAQQQDPFVRQANNEEDSDNDVNYGSSQPHLPKHLAGVASIATAAAAVAALSVIKAASKDLQVKLKQKVKDGQLEFMRFPLTLMSILEDEEQPDVAGFEAAQKQVPLRQSYDSFGQQPGTRSGQAQPVRQPAANHIACSQVVERQRGSSETPSRQDHQSGNYHPAPFPSAASGMVMPLQNTTPVHLCNGNASNGYESNGHGSNGRGSNGHGSNVHGSNGNGSNGQGSNGQGSNGQGSNGHGSNGQGSNGNGSNGQGSNVHGSNRQGSNGNGHVSNGHANGNGSHAEGSNFNGSKGNTSWQASRVTQSVKPAEVAAGTHGHVAWDGGGRGEGWGVRDPPLGSRMQQNGSGSPDIASDQLPPATGALPTAATSDTPHPRHPPRDNSAPAPHSGPPSAPPASFPSPHTPPADPATHDDGTTAKPANQHRAPNAARPLQHRKPPDHPPQRYVPWPLPRPPAPVTQPFSRPQAYCMPFAALTLPTAQPIPQNFVVSWMSSTTVAGPLPRLFPHMQNHMRGFQHDVNGLHAGNPQHMGTRVAPHPPGPDNASIRCPRRAQSDLVAAGPPQMPSAVQKRCHSQVINRTAEQPPPPHKRPRVKPSAVSDGSSSGLQGDRPVAARGCSGDNSSQPRTSEDGDRLEPSLRHGIVQNGELENKQDDVAEDRSQGSHRAGQSAKDTGYSAVPGEVDSGILADRPRAAEAGQRDGEEGGGGEGSSKMENERSGYGRSKELSDEDSNELRIGGEEQVAQAGCTEAGSGSGTEMTAQGA